MKLLSSIMDPYREDQAATPILDLEVQDSLTYVLFSKLQMLVDNLMESTSDDHAQETIVTEGIIFISRLLQFELGFISDWKQPQRELLQKLLLLVYRVAIVSFAFPQTYATVD